MFAQAIARHYKRTIKSAQHKKCMPKKYDQGWRESQPASQPSGECKLYYHKTDGGAEYLFDTFIECDNGHKEGAITDDTKYVIRLDGEPILMIN